MAVGFAERLRSTSDVLVMMSAMQTLLTEECGKPMEDHLSGWIITHPEEFQNVIRRTFAAGYDLLHIGTQASSPFRTKQFGLRDKVYELNYKSAKLAKEVTPENHYIAGLMSSTNPDWLEPVGNMTYKEVYDGYQEQLAGLLDGGVDLILISGNHLDETLIAIKVVKDKSNIPVIGGSAFYAGKKGFRTMTGADPKTTAAKLQEAGADIIGFMCGLMTKSRDPSDWYAGATALLKELRQGTNLPLYMAPDPGLPELINNKTVWPATPDDMAREVPNWVALGVRIIAGCCGMSLEHGRKVSAALKKLAK